MVSLPPRLALVVWSSLLLAGCPSDGIVATDKGEPETESDAPMTSGSEAGTSMGCQVGMVGCPCTGGGACDAGLVCNVNKLCESEPGVSTGTVTNVDLSTSSSGTSTATDESSGSSSSIVCATARPPDDGGPMPQMRRDL